MITLFIIVISLVYVFIASLLFYLSDKYIKDPVLFEALSVFWPIGLPIMIMIIIGILFIRLFEKIFDN